MNDPVSSAGSVTHAEEESALPGGRAAIKQAGEKMIVKPITVSINPEKVFKSVVPSPSASDTSLSGETFSNVSIKPVDVALSEYVNGLGALRKYNLYTIWTTCPYRIETSVVKITVTNKIQESLLEQEKPDFLEFIRQNTGNREITFEVTLELPPEQTDSKYLTNKERFALMAAQNPLLKKLQDVLGLDTETPV